MENLKGFKNLPILKYHFIYQTKNIINGKTYIGRHSTNNLDDGYIGSGTMLKRAIKKYGIHNFKCIHMCYFDTYQELLDEEIFLVTKKYCKLENNYNIVEGGTNPIMYGEDNPSWKGGKKYQPVGRKCTKGSANPNFGKKISGDQKQKTTKTKINKGQCVDVIVLGKLFRTKRECARYYNIHESTVDGRCVSKHFPDWKYKDTNYQKERETIYNNKVNKRYAKKREITKLKNIENQ